MKNTLELYKYSQDGDSVAFPDISNQIHLADYKYSAKRMGNAPSITATVNYPEQIDHLWDDNVYAEFRGERYFLKQLPSSSKDNTEITYKYSIELVSERIILENVYFFDVVKENTEDDRPVSNSSDFSFSGDVTQFAERFNYSAKWSGIDYTVVVDDDVVLEDKFIQFQDQFLYDALKGMYDTYQVPFYFVGKTIHIGYSQHTIDNVFKYGADDALLSISRNNTNANIVNRITGIGSDKNIPYYYPNKHPKGVVGARVENGNFAITIFDQKLFADAVELSKPIIFTPCLSDDAEIVGIRGLDAFFKTSQRWEESKYNPENGYYNGSYYFYNIKSTINVRYSGDISMTLNINSDDDAVNNNYYIKQTGHDLSDDYTTDTYLESGNGFKYFPGTINGLTVKFDDIPAGNYTLYLVIDKINYNPSLYQKRWYPTINSSGCWVNTATNKIIKLRDIGVTIAADIQPNIGAEIIPYCAKRVNVQKQLMPSIYRETDGEARFYNAENGKYKDDDGNDITFANQFSLAHPREYIHKDEEIYPTIEGMVNARGLRIDMFSEFAFDDNDNDEVYPAGTEKEGQYVHPYFFGKLRKFDGEHGFNIFDHAIEGQPMTVTMKSGKCSACEFTIGVDEETNSFNPVQVTLTDKITLDGRIPAGTLIRDNEGNVLCGRWPQQKPQKQERQNDTANFEVWIALKKDTQTFGDIMPSRIKNYIPEAGDKFALLNINLPEAYVLAAEDKLEKAVIEYMAENNIQKFNYSAKLSRIFFKENQAIANTLNENSKVSIEYGSFKEDLYVSSYSYSIKESDSLPEVSIELDDNIKIIKGAFDRVRNDFKLILLPAVDRIGAKLNEASNSLSNTTRIAKIANETAVAAKTSSDNLKVDIENVGVVASNAKLSAEKAELSATQAKDGIISVGNEVGSLKTTVNTVNTLANSAKTTADKAVEDINTVQKNTDTQFESVGKNINAIQKNVSSLEGLIGDEYNIWFENEEQKGDEPTLDNYPASDWASDDDYLNHDKDLYYSITLGRAWRFMYNEGEPFWEEITDADTITALTKAREALDKANEAMLAVQDLDYLKAVFGDTEVMNEHAVILSRLLAVSDDNDNVVAGVYGGGVTGLDDNGYKDASHGTLMMFAGADDAQHASTADFRVYSDGSIFANSGIFGGIMKRAKKSITNKNIQNFTYSDGNSTRVLDLTKTGSFISFWLTTSPDFTIRLPWYSSDQSLGSTDEFSDLLSILGTKLIVMFDVPLPDGYCFSTALFNNGEITSVCLSMDSASTYLFECKAGKDSAGRINIGWEMTVL